MSIKGKAYIAGVYEHPLRKAQGIPIAQIHAEVARGVLDDAGLEARDIDAYFCAGDGSHQQVTAGAYFTGGGSRTSTCTPSRSKSVGFSTTRVLAASPSTTSN